MPYAVTHILVPLIIVSLIRDFYSSKGKKKFPLHYVLLAGIGGILPDLDIAAYWILYFFGFPLDAVHRTFMHSLLFLAILLLLALIFRKTTFKIRKHKLNLGLIFLMLFIGSAIHLSLDATFEGKIVPFYPFASAPIGLDLVNHLPEPLNNLFIPSFEAALLTLWLIYLELKHKISDFI